MTDPIASCLAVAGETDWAVNEEEPHPSHKLLLGRDPVAGESLASQPTLSRFENAAGRGALYDMGCELAARVVERHRRRLGRVRRITIDLDPTDDPTHGAQQYSLFNGYYDNWWCVQQRLVCSAGDSPAGVIVRSPVAWIAGRGENRISEAYRQGLPWGDLRVIGPQRK